MLTGPQKVTVAEITYETKERIEDLASSLDADQEASVIAYIAIWNERKNKVHIRLEGGRDGVSLINDRLLDKITTRVRGIFGLPLTPPSLCPKPMPFAGGISVADVNSRKGDSDRPASGFTANLHRC